MIWIGGLMLTFGCIETVSIDAMILENSNALVVAITGCVLLLDM